MSSTSKIAAGVAHAVGQATEHLVQGRARTEADRRCDVCGNEYVAPLEIHLRGAVGTFDCFECAIHALAPVCEHCACRVIGHGVEAAGKIFCCLHCAKAEGLPEAAA